ncbi:MAG: ABC transporter substrate-binding protein [Acetobacter sp.]|nr:ABC transporter substrate-binding protein [Acetobacter sp.]
MTFLIRSRLLATFISLFTLGSVLLLSSPSSWAQHRDNSQKFIQNFGNVLVSIVDSPISVSEKKQKLIPLVQQNVDINTIGRYCLGRYWKVATVKQKTRYLKLFHQFLMNAITDKLGDYRGVSFTIGKITQNANDDTVETTITRLQHPPVTMQWVVSYTSGSPKIVDVIGEGASLRLTQRSDYSAFIAHHDGNIDTLLSAIQKQIDQHARAASDD